MIVITVSLTRQYALFTRQNSRWLLWLNAGDQEHGGANGDQPRVRNIIAHPPVPLTPTVVDRSGGGRRGAAVSSTGSDHRTIQLRSSHSSGCLSIYMLPGTYPSDAEGQGRLEQLRPSLSLRVTRVSPWYHVDAQAPA